MHESNDVLTQVGPGTPLGDLMRRYWHPIALSSQVEPDGAPLRTKLLGERFVVFRDTHGSAGVLDEFCMHRGASLALGRNEEGGLRCLYHGWKFSVDGAILETPNHADRHFCERMRAPSFPVHEQSGLIWTYIGPKELRPPFRRFGFDTVPTSNRAVCRANNKASWLPLFENGFDSSHVPILHGMAFQHGLLGARTRKNERVAPGAPDRKWSQLAPSYVCEDASFGFHYCALRTIGEGKYNARINAAILPEIRIVPTRTGSATLMCYMEVPMDDLETATYVMAYSPSERQDTEDLMVFLGYDPPLYDRETCNMNLEWSDRLGQDRSKMRQSWTGVPGIEVEDFVVSVSQAGWDRSKEHLVIADRGVLRLRQMILDAIEQVRAGEPPPAVDRADMTDVIGCDVDMSESDAWIDFATGNRGVGPALKAGQAK
jgi:phenylpropionate dioxygenase-like ring-hydroxylating dioxygenase large terminal subunit